MNGGRSRSRPLRLTVIAPRYHEEIIGGADLYLRTLVHGWTERGVDVRVLTTRDFDVKFEDSNTLLWSNSLPTNGRVGEESTVHRFSSYNLPAGARRRFSRAVDQASRRRRGNRRLDLEESYLGEGFHSLERWGDAFTFRWTRRYARIELRGGGIVAASFEVVSFQPARVRVFVDGKEHASLRLQKNQWETLVVGFSERRAATVIIEVTPPFRAEGDDRELGILVKSIRLTTSQGRTEEVVLDRDRESLLRSLPTSELAPNLDLDGQQWGFWSSLKDALLKGPVSPGLARGALHHALESDALLATHVPFLGLSYGWMAGRLARKPILMMPFFHLRDPFHHRPWLRRSLASADRVLCLNETMKSFVEERWRGRAHYLGGGVHPEELESPKISGGRFRKRHGLETEPLVLMVSRKVASKGYDTVCDAIRRLQARGVRCQFVLVGPDEDRVPLDGRVVRYLGALSREEVLDAFDACDVFVLPSSYESFGLAFLEAWMRRKPVVGHTRADSVRELIEVGRDGEVVSDADDLSLVLERLLRDSALRERMGERGYEKVRSRYTWQHVIQRGLEVLEEVSSPGRG